MLPSSRDRDVVDVVHGLLTALLDDAAVFPPGDASVPAAVAAHIGHRRAWYADLVGPLLVRASQVGDLLDAAAPGDDLRVGLVADSGLAGLVEGVGMLFDQDERAHAVQVEIPLPSGHPSGEAAAALVEQLALTTTAYVEVPRSGFDAALDVLAADGAERAKYRTGGTTPDAFPDEAELAAFLAGCLRRRLAFKLTAGLHHPVRGSYDGFEQHGFLNVLAAVDAGLRGGDADAMAAILRERDAQMLVPALEACDVASVRAAFVSFGCCGVRDPVDELVGLGLLRDGR